MNDLNTLAAWANILAIPIAIVSIVISILSSVWIYHRSKPKISLSCVIDPIEFPIEIKAGEALRGEIEIRYKKRAVKNLSILRAKVKNTGNSAIRKTHIVEEMAFIFPDDAELLRAPVIVSSKPENLRIDWKIENPPNKVFMVFDLLNPGDEITIEFLCAGASTIPQVEARIEGLKAIDSQTVVETRLMTNMKVSLTVLSLFLLVSGGYAVYFYFAADGPKGAYHSISNSLIFGVLVTIFFTSFAAIPFLIRYYVLAPLLELIKIQKKTK